MSVSERAWRISGRVQGVGYRRWAVRAAASLGVSGRVWNAPEGFVELHAKGSNEVLDQLQERLWVGPLFAKVTSVEAVTPEGPFPAAGLEVIY